VFIHGIGNKPPPDLLLPAWERALATNDGLDLGTMGIGSSMVYWADVMYPEPLEGGLESIDAAGAGEYGDVDLSWRDDLTGDEAEFVDELAADLDFDHEEPEEEVTVPPDEAGVEFERIPIPWPVKRFLMKLVLRDVHHYLFNSPSRPRPDAEFLVQQEIRGRVVEAIEQASSDGPVIVVSHSMGTVIAYDTLKRVPECPPVAGLVTMGSPLGRGELPPRFKPEWTKQDGYPEKLEGPWLNVFDRLDPVVGMGPSVCKQYRKHGQTVAEDIAAKNTGAWRHDINDYLSQPEFRNRLLALLDA
jgi:hypothetical protein